MLGLPLDSWILIFASVVIGLAIEGAFLRARRRDAPRTPDRETRP